MLAFCGRKLRSPCVLGTLGGILGVSSAASVACSHALPYYWYIQSWRTPILWHTHPSISCHSVFSHSNDSLQSVFVLLCSFIAVLSSQLFAATFSQSAS